MLILRSLPVTLVLLTVGCGDNESSQIDEGTFCQVNQQLYASAPVRLDVLFSIDSSEAMAPYQNKLDELMSNFVSVLDSFSQRPSLQLAVISAAPDRLGAFVGDECTSDGLEFLYDLQDPWWQCGNEQTSRCGVSNDGGDQASTARCMSRIESGGSDAPTPLASIDSALASDSVDGFLRPQSVVAFFVISSADDASAGSVDSFVDSFDDTLGKRLVLRTAIAPPQSERLASFDNASDNVIEIDGNWLDALLPLAEWAAVSLGIPCLNESVTRDDSDLSMPGLQTTCVAERDTAAGLKPVPACQMLTATRPHPETALPCFWLEPNTDASCDYLPRVELGPADSGGDVLLSCEASCES